MYVGRDTIGHEVDSSAIVTASAVERVEHLVEAARKAIASRFSRPP